MIIISKNKTLSIFLVLSIYMFLSCVNLKKLNNEIEIAQIAAIDTFLKKTTEKYDSSSISIMYSELEDLKENRQKEFKKRLRFRFNRNIDYYFIEERTLHPNTIGFQFFTDTNYMYYYYSLGFNNRAKFKKRTYSEVFEKTVEDYCYGYILAKKMYDWNDTILTSLCDTIKVLKYHDIKDWSLQEFRLFPYIGEIYISKIAVRKGKVDTTQALFLECIPIFLSLSQIELYRIPSV